MINDVLKGKIVQRHRHPQGSELVATYTLPLFSMTPAALTSCNEVYARDRGSECADGWTLFWILPGSCDRVQ